MMTVMLGKARVTKETTWWETLRASSASLVVYHVKMCPYLHRAAAVCFLDQRYQYAEMRRFLAAMHGRGGGGGGGGGHGIFVMEAGRLGGGVSTGDFFQQYGGGAGSGGDDEVHRFFENDAPAASGASEAAIANLPTRKVNSPRSFPH